MKKIITVALFAALLCGMILPVAVSAEPAILFQDDFESQELNNNYWIVEGTAYVPMFGGPLNSWYLDDWAGYHVLQSVYAGLGPIERTYSSNLSIRVDAWMFDDGGQMRTKHALGLWWAAYIGDNIGGDNEEGRVVYEVTVLYEERAVVITAAGDGAKGQEYFPDKTEVARWTMPDSEELVMDENDPTVFSIGMRVNGAQIDGYYNDQKVVSYTAPYASPYRCPVLFVNEGCWAGIDNFVVATADYDLFNEGSAPAPTPVDSTPSGGEPANEPEPTEKVIETKVETKVVEDTDENGEIVTRIETEIVTEEVVRPAPDTGNGGGNGGGGGTSARTGDAAIIVVAVMIVAVGAAIVVKKVGSR